MIDAELEIKKKKIINCLLDNDILVTSDIIDKLSNEKKVNLAFSRISRDKKIIDLDKLFEETIAKTLSVESAANKFNFNVRIIKSYDQITSKKITIQDFVYHLKARYKALEKILRQRVELSNVISINRILAKRDRDIVSMIGVVVDKRMTKNNNLFITMEDLTGTIKVLINKDKKELFEKAQNIVLDEVIGIIGNSADKLVFVKDVIFPDVPLNKEFKKCKDKAFALFMGDFHLGADLFLDKDFDKFLKWIKGETGSEKQKAIAKRVGYIFITGDLVEGVGIYPSQERNLIIKDVKEQYDTLAEKLKQIPSHINLIICPGNHDTVRISDPQPPISAEYARAVLDLPNVIMVSSPSLTNFHFSDSFPGFDVLLYHGFSLPYYSDNIEHIRAAGGMKKVDEVMKILLQKRHLAPTHGCNLFVPFRDHDPLVIDIIPDFFVTGHIHRCSASNYRNINLLNCSGWAKVSENQIKMGLIPQTSRVFAVNLSNRNIKILNFGDEKDE